MNEYKKFLVPTPVLDQKEVSSLDALTRRYNKLIAPSKVAKMGKKAGEFIPEKVKFFGTYNGYY